MKRTAPIVVGGPVFIGVLRFVVTVDGPAEAAALLAALTHRAHR